MLIVPAILKRCVSVAVAVIFLLSNIYLPHISSAEAMPDLTRAMFNSISCSTITECVAGGTYTDEDSKNQAFIAKKSADTWATQALSIPKNLQGYSNEITDVDCVTPDFCMAVGATADLSGHYPWIARFSNNEWSVQSLPSLPSKNSYPATISCASSNFCMLGGRWVKNDVTRPLVYVFDGVNWSRVPYDQPGFKLLYNIYDIQCDAPQDCMISGVKGAQYESKYSALIHYSQRAWGVDTSLREKQGGALSDLSCISPMHCTVVDRNYYGDLNGVFRHRDGAWQELQAGGGLTNNTDGLWWNGLSCASETSCVMSGSMRRDKLQSETQAMVSVEKDSQWQLTKIEPPNAEHSALKEVSCASSTRCVAVGFYSTGSGLSTFPLIAEFDGTMWKTVTLVADEDAPEDNVPVPETDAPAFVAFGDSLTTGGSIPTCRPDRKTSPWGCTATPPAASPYPDRLNAEFGYTDQKYRRVGIWGYTVQDAVRARQNGRNDEGTWQPQLATIEQATDIVVGALGINDLRFSDVLFWAKKYYAKGDQVEPAARQLLAERSADFDQLFASLAKARDNGALIVIGLYYNPYDSPNHYCGDLENIGNSIVNTIDAELERRARAENFNIADFRPAFRDKGAATSDSYVFGTQCKTSTAVADWLPKWMGGGGGKDAIAEGFDPHPNDKGTQAMAQTILRSF